MYFWRSMDEKVPEQCWHGPARVVLAQMPSTVWVSYHGGLLKCSPEHLRLWTDEERLAWETVPDELRTDPATDYRGRRQYVDLTQEPVPCPEQEIRAACRHSWSLSCAR